MRFEKFELRPFQSAQTREAVNVAVRTGLVPGGAVNIIGYHQRHLLVTFRHIDDLLGKADHVLCLGDLVNCSPQPAECVAWAMQHLSAEWLIQGNHDRAVSLGENPHWAWL